MYKTLIYQAVYVLLQVILFRIHNLQDTIEGVRKKGPNMAWRGVWLSTMQ